MTRGDKGKTVHSFRSFIYSLLTQQDYLLSVVPRAYVLKFYLQMKG